MNNGFTRANKNGDKSNNRRLTLQSETIRFRPITESDGVVRVINRSQHVLFPPGRLVRYNTRLQLSERVVSSPNSDLNRCILGLEGAVQKPLDSGLAVLERRPDGDGASDLELLHYVAGLKHVAGPLVGLGASFQALDRQHYGHSLRCLSSIHCHFLLQFSPIFLEGQIQPPILIKTRNSSSLKSEFLDHVIL